MDVFLRYKPLLGQLIAKDIKLKYRRSVLGYFWSILDPLMLMGIMVLVFSNMFRFEIANYPVYLIIGQTIYNFVSESTSQSTWAIIGNAALMKKTYVPKYIFTVSRVTSGLVNMIFAMGAMLYREDAVYSCNFGSSLHFCAWTWPASGMRNSFLSGCPAYIQRVFNSVDVCYSHILSHRTAVPEAYMDH